jgi:hemerythrin-like domain-containing protein
MTEAYQANIGCSLILVHKVVTRGLQVTIERSGAYEKAGFADPSVRDGFIVYVQSLATFLDAHHRVEDEIAFPYFKERLPKAPYDMLTRQHMAMVPLVDHIKAVAPNIGSAGADVALRDLQRTAARLEEGWQPHFKAEEEHFAPDRLIAVMSADEHAQMGSTIGAFNREDLQPDYLLVPFTLHNLAPEDRASLAEGMSPVVVQELVPGVWKERWQVMAPFLLV